MNDLLLNSNKSRKHQITTNKDGILYLMDNYLHGKKLYLKDHNPKIRVNTQRLDNGQFKLFLPSSYQAKTSLSLYSMIQKYIEIEMKHIESLNLGRHIYEPIKAHIAINSRKCPRLDVGDDSIVINQFKIFEQMNENHIDPQHLSITVKNYYMEYERSLNGQYPNAKLSTFEPYDTKDEPLADLIYSKKKILYLENTQNEDSYFTENEDLLNYGLLLGNDINSTMARFQKSKIASLLIYPILYKKQKKRDAALGYIKIWSEDSAIDFDSTISHLEDVHTALLEKIELCRKLHTFDTTQNIVDIGEGGLKMKVTDPQLISHFLNNPELIMNLRFELSNNVIDVNLQGEVVGHFSDKNDRYNACIAFSKSNKRQLTKLKKCLESWQLKKQSNSK